MRRPVSIEPEIARRVHDAAAEMIKPDPVHDDTSGKRIAWMRHPTCKSEPAPASILRRKLFELRRQLANRGQCARLKNLGWFANTAPVEQPGWRNFLWNDAVGAFQRRNG